MNVGTVIMVCVECAGALIPATHPVVRFGVLLAALSWFAFWTADALSSAVVAAIGFVLFTGFLVNRFGQLSWHGADDEARLMALALAVAGGVIAGQLRLAHAAHRLQEKEDQNV